MKRVILVGMGLAGAAAFIGFDAVEAFFDQTRSDVRSRLISPEVELQAQISGAEELARKCSESVVNGRVALSRLDSMIEERAGELKRREKALEVDRRVLEARRDLLGRGHEVYEINCEQVTRRMLNRDALLRAKAFATDSEICAHLKATLEELRMQRAQTAAEIEEAVVEQRRLQNEIAALQAELENLKARRAVAQTREEAAYVFDRSAFDGAREKISAIRAKIAEQNRRLDFYGRNGGSAKGLIPAGIEPAEEDGVEAITSVLGDSTQPSGAHVAVAGPAR